MLRNISACLFDNYELVSGTRFENIYLYYVFTKVAIIGSLHTVKSVMNVPIKTANQHFTVYKIIALSTRILKYKFFLYHSDFSYFALSSSQRDYALFTATDLQRCSSSSISVCLINMASLYTNSYVESNLHFQTTGEYGLCRRSTHLHHNTPTLQRHSTVWIFHFPQRTRQLTLPARQQELENI